MKFFEAHFKYQGNFVSRWIRLDTIISVDAVYNGGGVVNRLYIDHPGKSTEIADETMCRDFMMAWSNFVGGR